MKGKCFIIYDTLHFISCLRPLKLWNYLSNQWACLVSKWTKKPHIGLFPSGLSIEPTTYCNLRCSECIKGTGQLTRPEGMMSYEHYSELIDQASPYILSLLLYFQGEPFLHPHLFDMIRYAVNHNVYTITSTNGHFLDSSRAKATISSGLHRIIISMDGITRETYEKYRQGGNLSEVIQGIQNLAYWRQVLKKTQPRITIQFLVMQHNEHEIKSAKKAAIQAGADEISFKSPQMYDFSKAASFLPSISKYNRYIKTSNGQYRLKFKLKNACSRLWHSMVIASNGEVLPCCFDKNALFSCGSTYKNRLRTIWQNQHFHSFRQAILQHRTHISICNNCTEGLGKPVKKEAKQHQS